MIVKCLEKEFKTVESHILGLTYKDKPPLDGLCIHVVDTDDLYFYESKNEFGI